MDRRSEKLFPLAVWLLTFLLVSLGCGGTAATPTVPNAAKIEISGTVKFNSAYSPVGGSVAEYSVELTLQNSGQAGFTFNQAEGAFVNAAGKGLRSTSTNIEKGWFEIAAGSETTLEYATNGYTQDLLTDANGGPLFFQLTLYQDDAVVYGPRIAPLPELLDLLKETDPRMLMFQ